MPENEVANNTARRQFEIREGDQVARLNEDGSLKNDVLAKRFADTMRCFLDLVEAAKHYPALKKQWVEFLGEHPDRATDRVETSDTAAA